MIEKDLHNLPASELMGMMLSQSVVVTVEHDFHRINIYFKRNSGKVYAVDVEEIALDEFHIPDAWGAPVTSYDPLDCLYDTMDAIDNRDF